MMKMEKKKAYLITATTVVLSSVLASAYVWKRKKEEKRLADLYQAYQDNHSDCGYECENKEEDMPKRKYIELTKKQKG